jgi:D-alanyl-D-alanine dipeptidase
VSYFFQQEIPQQADFEWYQLKDIPIIDSHELLVDTVDIKGVHTQAMYFLQGIAGALPQCYVRQTIAEKLRAVNASLPDGYYLVVLDAWRPLEVQQQLRASFLQDIQARFPHLSEPEQLATLDQFVARPSDDPMCPSPHVTGGSVDVSLCDAAGHLLDMGSGFDAPVPASWTSALEGEPESPAQRNRRLLYHSMLAQGFSNMPSEWWHFDYGNQLWALKTGQAQAIYGLTGLSYSSESVLV